MYHHKTLLSWVTMAAMTALVIAACSPAATPAPTDTVAPLPSDTPPAAEATAVIPNSGATAAPTTATIVASTNSSLGQILTDAKGMTLYAYTKDAPDVSNCTDQCATNWPPVTVPQGTTPTAGDGITVTLATLTRADGSIQLTVNHMPVYYFASDTAAGDASGQGKGGVWYVFDASGNLVKTSSSTETPASSGGSSGGTGGGTVTDTPMPAPATTYP